MSRSASWRTRCEIGVCHRIDFGPWRSANRCETTPSGDRTPQQGSLRELAGVGINESGWVIVRRHTATGTVAELYKPLGP